MTSLCTKCGGDSQVKDSRPRPNGVIRRRRQCKTCHFSWSTEEVTVGLTPARLQTKSKRLRTAVHRVERFFIDYFREDLP